MAKQVLCSNNHYYDQERYAACPYCGAPELQNIETKAYDAAKPSMPPGPERSSDPSGVTVPYVDPTEADKRFRPVVGWLVCIDGKERGRDYRIQPERNFIGRHPSMDIVIQGDNEISRDRHAEINYDPRSKRFFLNRGADSSKNTYRNNDIVLTPVELSSGDLIELGSTKLLFIPFCGVHHNWFDKPPPSTTDRRPAEPETEPKPPESNEDAPTDHQPTDPQDDEQRTWVRSGPGKPWRQDE